MRRPPFLGLATALPALLSLCLAACSPPAERPSPRLAVAPDPAAALGVGFQVDALRHLLAPLLDATDPLRWADPQALLACDGPLALTVDGHPYVTGRPLPGRAFTLEWQGQGCRPAHDPALAISGRVRVVVYPDEDNFSAIVVPEGLTVRTAQGLARLERSFTAELDPATLPGRP